MSKMNLDPTLRAPTRKLRRKKLRLERMPFRTRKGEFGRYENPFTTFHSYNFSDRKRAQG